MMSHGLYWPKKGLKINLWFGIEFVYCTRYILIKDITRVACLCDPFLLHSSNL
jgi:hypothetical protein